MFNRFAYVIKFNYLILFLIIVIIILIICISMIRHEYKIFQKERLYVLDRQCKPEKMLDYLYTPTIIVELFYIILLIISTCGIMLFLQISNFDLN